jgi:arylsulfatase A-like enzyme
MTVDKERRRILRLLASAPLWPGAVIGVLASCKNKNEAGAAGGGKVAEPFGGGEPVEIPWKGKFLECDLVENLSFASLRNEGLLVDFGTTDYFKYALGGWRTGWGRSFIRDGVAYTHVTGVTTRLYFHWDRSEALVVRFRAKPIGGKYFSLYMNDKPVQKVDLTSNEWAVYSIEIPSSSVRAGENYLLLRWDATQKSAGEDLAGAMDYIHLLPASLSDRKSILPTHSAVGGKARAGKDEAPALLLAGGMSLGYWIEVPRDEPLFGFNLGLVGKDAPEMSLKVSASTDGSGPVELFSRTIQGTEAGKFRPEGVDLSPLRGKVVRLDIAALSGAPTEARLALVEPGLYTKSPPPAPAKPPRKARNAIVVMIDTLRADHLAPYAKTRVQTPVLDRFAREGVLFERFSAVEDWTKPSCATMLTGLYPCTHKTQTDMVRLPSSVRMISEELKGRGVATGAFIANGYVSGKFGFEKGWDHYTNYIREGKKTDAEYVFADAASWIEASKDKRFYAYVHTIDPHVPYSPPKDFLEMYDKEPYSGPVEPRMTHLLLEDIKKDKFKPTERDKERIKALYDGEISYHDKWFGGFLQKLNDLGLLEDTMVVVVSDHGEEFWDHGSVGHGHQIHQELIHVPFACMWKGVLPPQTRVPDNHDHSCLVPTIFDAMQLAPPKYLEGESVLRRMLGNPTTGPHAGFSTHQNDRQAVWSGRWKLLMRGPVKTYLYDVEDDVASTKDLDEDHPIALTYMRTLLGQFQGAPDKSRWRSRTMAHKSDLEVVEEKVEMDEELEEQLKALGYVK